MSKIATLLWQQNSHHSVGSSPLQDVDTMFPIQPGHQLSGWACAKRTHYFGPRCFLTSPFGSMYPRRAVSPSTWLCLSLLTWVTIELDEGGCRHSFPNQGGTSTRLPLLVDQKDGQIGHVCFPRMGWNLTGPLSQRCNCSPRCSSFPSRRKTAATSGGWRCLGVLAKIPLGWRGGGCRWWRWRLEEYLLIARIGDYVTWLTLLKWMTIHWLKHTEGGLVSGIRRGLDTGKGSKESMVGWASAAIVT